jgi:serine/threonine protein kinase
VFSRSGPSIPSEHEWKLTKQLEELQNRQTALRAVGEESKIVREQILSTRRQMRHPAILHDGATLDDRYLLLSEVGAGGYATVWKAHDLLVNCTVAIKVLHPHVAKCMVKRDRFFRGARAMVELGHDGIVKVLSPECLSDGFFFFVMEFVEGENLYQAVLQKSILPTDCTRVLSRILEVLSEAHLHPKRFVHRDIKPRNVLVRKNGSILLTDFDLVAAIDTTGGTHTGMLGTFNYAAPEQWDRPQDADSRADVYSAALTGLFILSARELSAIQVVRDPVGVVDSLPISRELKAVFCKAIALNASERFENAADFKTALLSPPPIEASRRKSARTRKGNESKSLGPKKRHGLPSIKSKSKVIEAMKTFDEQHRDGGLYRNFEKNSNHTYAIKYGEKLYPVKFIIELATGRPASSFSGGAGPPNELIKSLGFEVVNMRSDQSVISANEEAIDQSDGEEG